MDEDLPTIEELRALFEALRDATATVLGVIGSGVDDVLAADLPLIGDALTAEGAALTALLTDLAADAEAAFDDVLADLPTDPADLTDEAIDAALAALTAGLDDLEGVTATFDEPSGVVTVGVAGSETAAFEAAFAEGLGLADSEFLSFDGVVSGDATLTYDVALELDLRDGTAEFAPSAGPDPQDLVALDVSGAASVTGDASLGSLPIGLMGEATGALEAGLALRRDGATGLSLVATAGSASLDAAFETLLISELFPRVMATLALDFPFPLGDLAAGDVVAAPSIAFTDVSLDPGSIVETLQSTFGEVIDTLDVFPVGQLVDFLLQPFPILGDLGFVSDALDVGVEDGEITVVDLVVFAIETFNTDLDVPSFDFLTVADTLLEFGDVLEGSGVPAGDALELGDITAEADDLAGLIDGAIDLPEFVDLSALASTGDLFDELGTLGSTFDEFDEEFNDLDATSFEIPLLDDPLRTVTELLFSSITGDPVTVVSLDLPPLGIPPVGPKLTLPFGIFSLTLEGLLGAGVDLGAGFAIDLSEPPDFANNFFLFSDADADPLDPDPVLFASAEIAASGLVDLFIAAAGIRGGVRATTDIFLNDPDMDGRSFLSELTPCTFSDIEGEISAFLAAVARIGFGPFSFTVSEEFVDVVVAQFGGDPCSGSGSEGVREIDMSGLAVVDPGDAGTLILNVGGRAGERELASDIDVDIGREDPQSPAVFETYRLGPGRDEEGAAAPGDVRVTFNGVADTFESTTALDLVTGDFGSEDDVLATEAGFDLALDVSGGDGNDVLRGGTADDALSGDAGGDVLRGGEGSDTLEGGSGDDLLVGGAGADVLDGGADFDAVDYAGSDAAVTLTPLAGSPGSFVGAGGHAQGDVVSDVEHLIGSAFGDRLEGDPEGLSADIGNILDGRAGDDTLIGGSRPDLLLGGPGADLHVGGENDPADAEDRASYAASRGGVLVDLGANFGLYADAQGDRFESVEFMQGSAHADGLFGDGADNELQGLSGDDRLDGRAGVDVVDGGLGDDTVIGRGDGDTLSGGGFANFRTGRDVIDYRAAAGALDLSLITGQAAVLGAGADTLVAAETVDVSALPGALITSPIARFSTFEDVVGTSFDDVIEGDDGANTLEGRAGDDALFGEGSRDTLIGGLGADLLDGGADRDLADYSDAATGVGIDLAAGTGTDFAPGANLAQGDALVDVEDVTTGAGDDVLVGSGVANVLDPGGFTGTGVEVVTGLGGVDTLVLDYAGAPDAAAGFDLLLGQTGSGRVDQVSLGRRLDLESMERLRVTTGEGDDRIRSFTNGSDVISTGGGDDRVEASFGLDVVFLGDGDDTAIRTIDPDFNFVDLVPAESFFFDGGDGFDGVALDISGVDTPLSLSLTPETADVAAAIDDLVAGFGVLRNFERIIGLTTGGGDDAIEVLIGDGLDLDAGDGDNTVRLGDGDDAVRMGRGDDVIETGGGDDFISAGQGEDTIVPGDFGIFDGVESIFTGEGSDRIVLGDERGRFYGEGATDADGAPLEEHVVIFDFEVSNLAAESGFEPDTLVLAGEREDYALNPDFGFNQQFIGFELVLTEQTGLAGVKVAELRTSVRDFDLNSEQFEFVPVGPGVQGGLGLDPGLPEPPDLGPGLFALAAADERASDLAAVQDGDGPVLAAAGGGPEAGGGASPGGTVELAATAADGPAAVARAGEGEVRDELAGLGLAISDVDLDGDSRAFGTFTNLFGVESGVVVSTGDARDAVGPNTVDGPRAAAPVQGASVPLTFEIVSAPSDPLVVYQAALPDIGVIESLQINDDDDLVGGSAGVFSGFDLDFIAISETDLDTVAFADATELASTSLYPRLDVFDFGPGSVNFVPGTIRGGSAADLNGSAGTLVDALGVTLDAPDDDGTTASPNTFLSLGDGGSVAFDLAAPVDTSGPTKFLTIVEVGGGEAIDDNVTVSVDPAVPTGDASTDLGAPGTEGDRSVLTATFTREAASDGLAPVAGVVFASEAFPELGGAVDPDSVQIRVNGLSVGRLSDGVPLTFNDLAPSPFGIFHPDLVLNPAETGPLADRLALDGHTRPLLISAPLVAGENTLEIVVEDGADGLLDSAVFLFDAEGLPFVGGTPGDDHVEGTEDEDVIRTGSGDDKIDGLGGDDVIEGDSGDDTIDPGAGDDTVDGGVGRDVLCIEADPSEVTFEFLDDGTLVVTGPDGRDEVRNVEAIVFKGAGEDGEDVEVEIDDPGLGEPPNLPVAALDDALVLPLGAASVGGLDVLANDLNPDEDPATGDVLRVVQIEAGGVFDPVPEGGASGLQGAHGVLTIGSDGAVSYALDDPAAPRPDVDIFVYTAEDGRGGRDAATLTVEISDGTGANRAPVVTPGQALSVAAGSAAGTVVGAVAAADPDGDPITFALLGGNDDLDADGTAAFALDPATGEVTVADPDDVDPLVGPSFALEVQASDGDLASVPETVAVTVSGGGAGGARLVSFAPIAAEGLDAVDADGVVTPGEIEGLPPSDADADRNLYAVVGDGDRDLEAGETGFKLSDFGAQGRLTTLPENATADDPVVVTAHGRIDAGSIGEITERVRFTADGFGLDSGGPGGADAPYLNGRESLTFDARGAELSSVRFTAQLRDDAGTAILLLDADGSLVETPGGAVAGAASKADEVEDALLALAVADGTDVVIDVEERVITLDGPTLSTITNDAFFDALMAAGGDVITLGGGRAQSFGVQDLVLELGEAPNRVFLDAASILAVTEDGDVGGTEVRFPVAFDAPPTDAVTVQHSVFVGEAQVGLLGETTIPPEGGDVVVRATNDAVDNGDDAIRLVLTALTDDAGGTVSLDPLRASGVALVEEDDADLPSGPPDGAADDALAALDDVEPATTLLDPFGSQAPSEVGL